MRSVSTRRNSGKGRTLDDKIEKKKKKKSHISECPVRVDAHWPVCVFQTLMLLSSLALAMFFPSGLQTTERTLPFSMTWFSTRSNSGRERKLDEKKKTHQSECPLRVDQKKEFLKKNRNPIVQKQIILQAWVPGQRRVAVPGLDVPDLHSFVPTSTC